MNPDLIERWFLAVCQDCTPRLPQPFFDEVERDGWAERHRAGTGHEVTTFRVG